MKPICEIVHLQRVEPLPRRCKRQPGLSVLPTTRMLRIVVAAIVAPGRRRHKRPQFLLTENPHMLVVILGSEVIIPAVCVMLDEAVGLRPDREPIRATEIIWKGHSTLPTNDAGVI